MLTALEALERSPYAGRIGWDLFLNPDEELGSPGSSPLIERLAAGKNGRAAVRALPAGRGAGQRAEGVGELYRDHDRPIGPRRPRPAERPERDPRSGRVRRRGGGWTDLDRGVSVNVGRIEGGGPVNVVPDRASCRFNVRVRTVEQQHEIEGQLRQWSSK